MKAKQDWIEIDGARGEGGGQMLRSALTLSMISGTPFRIAGIRARRARPGLLRQHLTAVHAATEICSASVQGAEPGSLKLDFAPGSVRGGKYRYAIGTAGSCTLVLQTLLPALWFADAPSTLSVSGGTHNPAAPSADFLLRAWLPLMHRMGVRSEIGLMRHGFYPAGGGEMRASVQPVNALQALDLCERGDHLGTTATAVLAGLPANIAQRELQHIEKQLADCTLETRVLDAAQGPGNVLLVEMRHRQLNEIFAAFGEKGLPAEAVADRAGKQARRYREGGAAVGEHLADQLLLPLALAGAGRFTTAFASSHFRSNCEVIERFLPVRFVLEQDAAGLRVSVERKTTVQA